MRRVAPGLVAAGVLLSALGVLLFARAGAPEGAAAPPLGPTSAYQSRLELSFDGHRWSGAWTAAQLVGLGLAVLGLLLLAGLAGRRLGHRARPGVGAARGALAVGGVGCLLVAAGTAVVLSAAPEPVVVYSGSYEPLTCPGWPDCGEAPWRVVLGAAQLGGLGAAVVGALVLAAVSGRLLGADRPVDQA